jgi:hypothetical protein
VGPGAPGVLKKSACGSHSLVVGMKERYEGR